MTILGHIPSYYGCSYIVEMTSEEMGTIVAGKGDLQSERVGSKLTVGKHWRRVADINDAQQRLNGCASSLRAVADLLGTINVVVPPADEAPKDGGAK